MAENIYYIVDRPKITNLNINHSEVPTGGKVTLTLSISQNPIYLEPTTHYPGELQVGEFGG